jgi:hypothetical protein
MTTDLGVVLESTSDSGNEMAEALLERPHLPSALGSDAKKSAQLFIEKIAANKVRAFESTIDPGTGEYLDDPYAQNKSLSEHVAADYQGRFLIELVQNGNDAHPQERCDGEIEILLADEGSFGTIYVANRGLPFSKEQASALARIGKSPPANRSVTRASASEV